MSKSDEELLPLAVQGDGDALGELLMRFGPQVRGAVASEIGTVWASSLDADDVMQVSYLEAFLQIRNFKPHGIPSFVSWLKQIAQRNLQDAIRGLTRAKRPDPRNQLRAAATEESVWNLFDLVGEHSSTPSRAVRREEQKMVLEQCLRRLPPDYELVVRMYDLEEREIEAIAEHLKRTPGAVYMLRARALDRLKEILPDTSAIMTRSN